jgi:acyl-CoA thioesterase FadM
VLYNESTDTANAVMTLTVACMHRQTGKSMPLPPPIRDALLSALPAQ